MSNGPKEVISPFVLRALACDMEEMQSPQAWADRCRAAAAEIEKLRAQNERLATSNHAYLSNYQEAADEIEKLRAALQTARRDALEEAARVAEHCDHPWVEAREAEHEAAALMAGTIAAAIRALKGEGDE